MEIELIEPMLCKTTFPKKYVPTEWITQIKYDGTRCIAYKFGGKVKLYTRSQKSELSEQYPELVKELEEVFPYDNIILDGEIVFFPIEPKGNEDKYGKFMTALATDETKAGYKVKYMVFDIIKHNLYDFTTWSLENRLAYLLNLFNDRTFNTIKLVKTYFYTNYKDLFNVVVDEGGEGVVLKKLEDHYLPGKRRWLKVKVKDTSDVYILGMTRGTGKRAKTFGSLIIGNYIDNEMVCQGKCSGYNDEELKYLFKKISAMDDYDYLDVDIPKGAIKTVEPTLMVEIEYMEVTEDGMFRHPRYVRLREDKEE